jgi:hypothetical protein
MSPDQQAQLDWVKSPFCLDRKTCVEVARTGDGNVAMRDTNGHVVTYTPAEITAFFDGVRGGTFNQFAG